MTLLLSVLLKVSKSDGIEMDGCRYGYIRRKDRQ